MQVYSYVDRTKVEVERKGKVIRTRWVVINKGSPEKPLIKARLVAQEFAKDEHRDDLFAGTPPLYGIRVVISLRQDAQTC